MNKTQRKTLEKIANQLDDLRDEISDIHGQEEDKANRAPNQALEEQFWINAGCLDEGLTSLDDAIASIRDVVEERL